MIERTMKRISAEQKAPWAGFVILIVLYFAANIATTRVVRMQGQINFGDLHMAYAQFAGVLSALANICIILLVVYYKRLGFIAALVLLLGQFPMLIVNLILRHNVNSIPGVFTNVFTLIAIATLRINEGMTERFRKRMAEQAITDTLTSLPNRFACSELIADLIKHNTRFTLVSIDINNFKNINDTMGFDVGNKLLVEIASRWKAIADSGDTGTLDIVSRLSGDEFAIVIRDYSSTADIVRTIEKYESVLGEKLSADGYELYITASFGYAEYPTDADNLDSLFTYSDAAMSEVKRVNSSNHILRFNPELVRTERTLEIEHKIRKALESDTIFFNLQPQYDMAHKLRGFEALARMNDEEGNIVSRASSYLLQRRSDW